MTRAFTLALLVAGTAGLLAPAAPASARAGQYRAELAAPAPAPRLIARDLVWSCAGTGCVAAQSTSLPATDCAALARQAGALRSFALDGRSLPADALEKCNAKAR